MGKGGYLVGLVPGEDAEVVVAPWLAAPLVVRGHHQVAGDVVAALLPGPVVTEKKLLS